MVSTLRVSDSLGPRWGPKICISNMLPLVLLVFRSYLENHWSKWLSAGLVSSRKETAATSLHNFMKYVLVRVLETDFEKRILSLALVSGLP